MIFDGQCFGRAPNASFAGAGCCGWGLVAVTRFSAVERRAGCMTVGARPKLPVIVAKLCRLRLAGKASSLAMGLANARAGWTTLGFLLMLEFGMRDIVRLHASALIPISIAANPRLRAVAMLRPKCNSATTCPLPIVVPNTGCFAPDGVGCVLLKSGQFAKG